MWKKKQEDSELSGRWFERFGEVAEWLELWTGIGIFPSFFGSANPTPSVRRGGIWMENVTLFSNQNF